MFVMVFSVPVNHEHRDCTVCVHLKLTGLFYETRCLNVIPTEDLQVAMLCDHLASTLSCERLKFMHHNPSESNRRLGGKEIYHIL